MSLDDSKHTETWARNVNRVGAVERLAAAVKDCA